MVIRALLVVVLLACGGRVRAPATEPTPPTSVVLYRDRALVAQRVVVDVPPASKATVELEVAAGIGPDDVFVVDPGGLVISDLRVVGGAPAKPVVEPVAVDEESDDDDDEGERKPAPPKPPPPPEPPPRPTKITLQVGAPREGRFALRLGYLTDRITWDAAYTLTTTAERSRGVLRGAVAIRNATGIALPDVRLSLVDSDHAVARARSAEQLSTKLAKTEASTTPVAAMRELGVTDLVEGDTRVELLAPQTRKLRSVLVYDPIGTKLDRNLDYPVRDASLGIHPPATPHVTESFEIVRDRAASAGLPGGPVRLLERRPDGSLSLLGEARMFESSTRVADVDTVALGTAQGVTGKRERRELTVDDDNARLAEEFVISIDNKRTHPIEVVLREHLYRHQTWHLAYYSSSVVAKQEGAQQISLRLQVPARTRSRILYVVVYPWKKPAPR
ncbi:MAG TPA: hypothetical protein VIU61_27825 [Kofleriaceae bacterium]